MLDDEVKVGEIGGGVVDIVNVKGVAAKRVNSRALVHVDVLDAQLFG